MDRRTSIKTLFVITAGVTLVPSCLEDRSKSSILLKNMKIDGKQEKLLAELAGTIIPTTDTPGAKEVSAHLFALKMVDDCYDNEGRKKFVTDLKEFERFTKKRFGKSFTDCNQLQRDELLRDIESKKDVSEDVASFYSTMKRLTIQGFLSSQYFLTKVQVYELVPGRFHGCVPVSKSN